MSRDFSLNALRELAEQRGPLAEICEMPGGASRRRFFRVNWLSGGSAVAMFFPDERTTGAARLPRPPRRWPFIEMQQLLRAQGVRVPQILGEDCEHGWLLVEDFGQTTLAELLKHQPEQRERMVRRAVSDLARTQARLASAPDASVFRQRSLDAAFLRSELDHFLEYGLHARGIEPGPAKVASFRRLSRLLCERIAQQPYGFTHRDYQSRNLMICEHPTIDGSEQQRGFELGWVDFQDATLGPRTYDLVALLKDSYQSFDADFVRIRLQEYVAHRELPTTDLDAIYTEFDLLTIQRKLKDAGRFVFIEKDNGDASYLPYVEPSLCMVQEALQRRRELPVVRELEDLLRELLSWA